MTYHLEGCFVILKWNLYLFILVHKSVVNAFYFHKYSYILKLIKLNER